jgi:hypothetical protein
MDPWLALMVGIVGTLAWQKFYGHHSNPIPTRGIPDLRAARKLAQHQSTVERGKIVNVSKDGDGYRIVYGNRPSELGSFLNGKPTARMM